MEEILCKYFEVVTYKSYSSAASALYREVTALINYKYNNYKCIQITISWVVFFFYIALVNLFVFRSRTTYCHICRVPTLDHTV